MKSALNVSKTNQTCMYVGEYDEFAGTVGPRPGRKKCVDAVFQLLNSGDYSKKNCGRAGSSDLGT